MKIQNIISWAARIAAAVILLQTLYFKFTAHPESVALFTKLSVEPYGRIGTGVIELITGILLLIPATAFLGGFLAMGLMLGAILSHLTIIGIESDGDMGQLFTLAIIVMVLSLIIQFLHRKEGLVLIDKYLPKKKSIYFNRNQNTLE
jgi:putative oxidoreductase